MENVHFYFPLFDHFYIDIYNIIQGFIVIICYGENKGVYYWDDAYNFKNSDDENNMYWIASSFNEFIKLLGERIK